MGFLEGKTEEESIMKHPKAIGFIKRTYEWLRSIEELSELQRLMLKRMLLPFEYFSKRNEDTNTVIEKCFNEGEEGYRLDEQISDLAGLPRIFSMYKKDHIPTLETISEPDKRELYSICGGIAGAAYEASDCHHNTFCVIENCIYSIGSLKSVIPTRTKSAEEKRLGHLDLGFDHKNEILRVYAYLGGNKAPVNKWLAACLWYMLTHGHAGLHNFTGRHKALIDTMNEKGMNVLI